MTRFMRVLAAFLVLWLAASPALASPFSLHIRGKGVSGGTWNGTTIDCHGVAYPLGVIAAGAQDAWDTDCTAGPRVSSWNALPSTGGDYTLDTNDFTVSGGTHTLTAPDFYSKNLEVFGGADVTINDGRFSCNGSTSCPFGKLIAIGYDSSGSFETAGTLRLNYADFDSTGRTTLSQMEIFVVQGSSFYSSHTRFHKGAMDYIQTGDDAVIVYSDHDIFTAYCLAGVTGPSGDHCEAIHLYGKRLEAHYTRFDSTLEGPIAGGYSGELFLDGHVATGPQTVILDHCVVNMTQALGSYPINFVGDATMTVSMGNCALKRGLSGYINNAGKTFVETAPNYDIDTGAQLICGVTSGYPASCFLALFVFYRRRRVANDNDAMGVRKAAA